MNCEYCNKKIKKGRKKRYCCHKCNRNDYYQKILKYKERIIYDLCKCGGKKQSSSKRCQKCFNSNKYKGQVSRSTLR